jgi:hypothetical protein
MFKCKNKFWLENISDLFCSVNLIPLDGMSIDSQMNCLTRLVIIIFLILHFLEFKHSVLFLLLSLLFIIILYYIQRNQMDHFKKESLNIEQLKCFNNNYEISKSLQNSKLDNKGLSVSNSEKPRFCNDEVLLQFNDTKYMSENQKLVGPPNPKTLIAPIIKPPLADLNYWRANNLVTHSAINEDTQTDVYASGYHISAFCDNSFNEKNISKNEKTYNFQEFPQYGVSINNVTKKPVKENFEFPYAIRENEPGWINTSCGYNPEQLYNSGLPTNFATGNCQQNPLMNKYNTNIFTQTIQPGVYTYNQVNEPINSNIGISFNQQFQPLSSKINSDESITYIQHDPRLIQNSIIEPNIEVIEDINVSNIYDPRHSGYGTSYRSYTDNNIGQTRFFYKDIDSIKMPNYITRNAIDFSPFADSYGPLPENGEYGNKYNSDIRAIANDAWLKNNIQQRNDLMERSMRKVNSNAWQQRMYPIHKGNQKMLGGMSSCK